MKRIIAPIVLVLALIGCASDESVRDNSTRTDKWYSIVDTQNNVTLRCIDQVSVTSDNHTVRVPVCYKVANDLTNG